MKKMFIASAIMLFAVGAMTSCKDSAENGCTCDYKVTMEYEGQSMTEEGTRDVSAAEVKEEGFSSCKAYASAMEKEAKEDSYIKSASISCKGK